MTQPKLTRKQIEMYRNRCIELEMANERLLADFALKAIDALEKYKGVAIRIDETGVMKIEGDFTAEALSLIDLGDEKAGEG